MTSSNYNKCCLQRILELCKDNKQVFVAIGGLSRSGKSTLTIDLQQKLSDNHINSIIIPLDYWILPLERRKSSMNVTDRFQFEKMTSDIAQLITKQEISIYPYEAQTRSISTIPVAISIRNKQVIFFDGVIALNHPYIIENSDLKIYVEISEEVRKQRFSDFYKQKGLNNIEIEYLYSMRQKDESPWIVPSKENADLIINY